MNEKPWRCSSVVEYLSGTLMTGQVGLAIFMSPWFKSQVLDKTFSGCPSHPLLTASIPGIPAPAKATPSILLPAMFLPCLLWLTWFQEWSISSPLGYAGTFYLVRRWWWRVGSCSWMNWILVNPVFNKGHILLLWPQNAVLSSFSLVTSHLKSRPLTLTFIPPGSFFSRDLFIFNFQDTTQRLLCIFSCK